MIYLVQLILLGLSVLEAWWHSVLIRENRPIKHGWWALAYICLILAAVGWQCGNLTPLYKIGLFAAACGAGHLVVFNIALNRFRRLSWQYISPTSTSLIDELEYRIAGQRVWLVEAFFALIFLTIQLFL